MNQQESSRNPQSERKRWPEFGEHATGNYKLAKCSYVLNRTMTTLARAVGWSEDRRAGCGVGG